MITKIWNQVNQEIESHIQAMSTMTDLYNEAFGYPWGGIFLWAMIGSFTGLLWVIL